MKEIGAVKGAMDTEELIGDLTLEQVKNVVEAKKEMFLEKTFKAAVKSVLGTALSVGATVEGENPKTIQKRIDNGEYDDQLQEDL
jgi:large subunit ribosomal protein L11